MDFPNPAHTLSYPTQQNKENVFVSYSFILHKLNLRGFIEKVPTIHVDKNDETGVALNYSTARLLRDFSAFDIFSTKDPNTLLCNSTEEDILNWQHSIEVVDEDYSINKSTPKGATPGDTAKAKYKAYFKAILSQFKSDFLAYLYNFDSSNPMGVVDLGQDITTYVHSIEELRTSLAGLGEGNPVTLTMDATLVASPTDFGLLSGPEFYTPKDKKPAYLYVEENDIIEIRASYFSDRQISIPFTIDSSNGSKAVYYGFVGTISKEERPDQNDRLLVTLYGLSKILNLSYLITDPAISSQFEDGTFEVFKMSPTVFDNIFNEKNAFEIFSLVLKTALFVSPTLYDSKEEKAYYTFPLPSESECELTQNAQGLNQLRIIQDVPKGMLDQINKKNEDLDKLDAEIANLKAQASTPEIKKQIDAAEQKKKALFVGQEAAFAAVKRIFSVQKLNEFSFQIMFYVLYLYGVVKYRTQLEYSPDDIDKFRAFAVADMGAKGFQAYVTTIRNAFKLFYSSLAAPSQIMDVIHNATFLEIFETRNGIIRLKFPSYNELSVDASAEDVPKESVQQVPYIGIDGTSTGVVNVDMTYVVSPEDIINFAFNRSDISLNSRQDYRFVFPFLGTQAVTGGHFTDIGLLTKYGLRLSDPKENANVVNQRLGNVFGAVSLALGNAATRKIVMSVANNREYEIGKLYFIPRTNGEGSDIQKRIFWKGFVGYLIDQTTSYRNGEVSTHTLEFNYVREAVLRWDSALVKNVTSIAPANSLTVRAIFPFLPDVKTLAELLIKNPDMGKSNNPQNPVSTGDVEGDQISNDEFYMIYNNTTPNGGPPVDTKNPINVGKYSTDFYAPSVRSQFGADGLHNFFLSQLFLLDQYAFKNIVLRGQVQDTFSLTPQYISSGIAGVSPQAQYYGSFAHGYDNTKRIKRFMAITLGVGICQRAFGSLPGNSQYTYDYILSQMETDYAVSGSSGTSLFTIPLNGNELHIVVYQYGFAGKTVLVACGALKNAGTVRVIDGVQAVQMLVWVSPGALYVNQSSAGVLRQDRTTRLFDVAGSTAPQNGAEFSLRNLVNRGALQNYGPVNMNDYINTVDLSDSYLGAEYAVSTPFAGRRQLLKDAYLADVPPVEGSDADTLIKMVNTTSGMEQSDIDDQMKGRRMVLVPEVFDRIKLSDFVGGLLKLDAILISSGSTNLTAGIDPAALTALTTVSGFHSAAGQNMEAIVSDTIGKEILAYTGSSTYSAKGAVEKFLSATGLLYGGYSVRFVIASDHSDMAAALTGSSFDLLDYRFSDGSVSKTAGAMWGLLNTTNNALQLVQDPLESDDSKQKRSGAAATSGASSQSSKEPSSMASSATSKTTAATGNASPGQLKQIPLGLTLDNTNIKLVPSSFRDFYPSESMIGTLPTNYSPASVNFNFRFYFDPARGAAVRTTPALILKIDRSKTDDIYIQKARYLVLNLVGKATNIKDPNRGAAEINTLIKDRYISGPA